MKLDRSLLRPVMALALAIALPGIAVAQQGGTAAQQAGNARAASAMRARFVGADARIGKAERSGAITHAWAAVLRREVAEARSSMATLSHRQGFVSGGELASYTRTLNGVDAALGRTGGAGFGFGDTGHGLGYDCRNEAVAVAIPGQRLDDALAQLRLATRCPISGTALAHGKRSRPVVGTMTPTAALQAMLSGTGLEGNAIRGGFQVTNVPR